MAQAFIIAIVVAAGFWTWQATSNVLLTILAIIVAGFVGSLICFTFHQLRRKRLMGFSSIRELNEFDRDMNELRTTVTSNIEKDLSALEEEARREGYASLSAKNNAMMREKLAAIREENGQNE